MRTIAQAMDDIKERDPNTALTLYALKRAVLSGKIPHIPVGKNKKLIDVNTVFDYLYGDVEDKKKGSGTDITRIEE